MLARKVRQVVSVLPVGGHAHHAKDRRDVLALQHDVEVQRATALQRDGGGEGLVEASERPARAAWRRVAHALRVVPGEHPRVGLVLQSLHQEGPGEVSLEQALVVVVAQVPEVERAGDPGGPEVRRVVLPAGGRLHAHGAVGPDAVDGVQLERRRRAAAGQDRDEGAGELEAGRIGEQEVLEEGQSPPQRRPRLHLGELAHPSLEQVLEHDRRAPHGLAEGLVGDVHRGVDLAVDGEGVAHPSLGVRGARQGREDHRDDDETEVEGAVALEHAQVLGERVEAHRREEPREAFGERQGDPLLGGALQGGEGVAVTTRGRGRTRIRGERGAALLEPVRHGARSSQRKKRRQFLAQTFPQADPLRWPACSRLLAAAVRWSASAPRSCASASGGRGSPRHVRENASAHPSETSAAPTSRPGPSRDA